MQTQIRFTDEELRAGLAVFSCDHLTGAQTGEGEIDYERIRREWTENGILVQSDSGSRFSGLPELALLTMADAGAVLSLSESLKEEKAGSCCSIYLKGETIILLTKQPDEDMWDIIWLPFIPYAIRAAYIYYRSVLDRIMDDGGTIRYIMKENEELSGELTAEPEDKTALVMTSCGERQNVDMAEAFDMMQQFLVRAHGRCIKEMIGNGSN